MNLSASHIGRVCDNATRWVVHAKLAWSRGPAISLPDREITLALAPDRLADLTLAVPPFGNPGHTRDLPAAALGAVAARLTIFGSSRERRQNDEAHLE